MRFLSFVRFHFNLTPFVVPRLTLLARNYLYYAVAPTPVIAELMPEPLNEEQIPSID